MSWMNAAPATFAGRSRRGSRLADIAIRRVRLRRRVALDVAREILGRGKIPVVMPGRRIAATEHAVLHRQFRRAAIQPLRQPVQHARAQLRRHQPHRTAGHLDRLAARGLAFVRRILRIARQHRDALQVHVQFIGGDLRQRGDVALAKLHLADCEAHRAVRLEADPLLHAAVVLDRQRQRVAHAPFPSRSMAAAFSTARRMRGCAPQRQRFLSSAATMSARVGGGLRSSSAFALIRCRTDSSRTGPPAHRGRPAAADAAAPPYPAPRSW